MDKSGDFIFGFFAEKVTETRVKKMTSALKYCFSLEIIKINNFISEVETKNFLEKKSWRYISSRRTLSCSFGCYHFFSCYVFRFSRRLSSYVQDDLSRPVLADIRRVGWIVMLLQLVAREVGDHMKDEFPFRSKKKLNLKVEAVN